MRLLALIHGGLALPSFDWHRPPSEPVLLTNVNQTYHIERSGIKLTKSLRLPVLIRISNDSLTNPVLLTRIQINTADGGPELPHVLFSHRSRFGGSSEVQYEFSNFCEWLFSDGRSEVAIPLPKENLQHKQGVRYRDVLLYAGFGDHAERIVDLDVDLTVSDDRPDFHSRFGKGCDSLRNPATIAELIKKSDLRSTNKDLVVRKDLSTGLISDVPLDRDNFLTMLVDIPAADDDVYPRLTLSVPPSAVKVLAASYFHDTIWNAKVMAPQHNGEYDLSPFTRSIRTRSIFSGRSVAVALFILSNASSSLPPVKYSLHTRPSGSLVSLSPPPPILETIHVQWDLGLLLIQLTSLAFVFLLVQGLAQTISHFADKGAGYEMLAASGPCDARERTGL